MDQQQLINLLTNYKLSKNKILKKKLKTQENDYVGSVKEFKGERFYSYQKEGEHEFIIARNANFLFKPLINLKISNINLKDNKFILDINYDKQNNNAVKLSLLIGEEKIPLSKVDNYYTFEEKELEKVTLNELLIIEASFKSLIDNNIYHCQEYIKYTQFPNLKNKNLEVKKTRDNNVQIFNVNYTQAHKDRISKKLQEFENPKILTGLIENTQDIKELEKQFFIRTFTYSGINYLFISNDQNFLNNKTERYFKNRLFKKKLKLLKTPVKGLYNTLGYEKYEKVRKRARKMKAIKSPYIYYCENINNFEIDDEKVFIYANDGNDLIGSMFSIVKHLEKYNKKVYIGTKNVPKIKAKKVKYNLKMTILKQNSKDFYYHLATSKYLFNDSTFPPHYIKNEKQIYINTWHGVPLKHMGRKIEYSKLELANTQRNFFQADKVLLRNNYSINIFSNDYMIDKSKFKYIGAPEIDLLLNTKKGHSKKPKVVWIPTWRGFWGDGDSQQENLDVLNKVESVTKKLRSKVDIYYKAHPHIYKLIEEEKIKFKEVNFLSESEELYTVLANADAIITDYSSIMFDYAILNKPIILDIFDEEKYLEDRGLYMPIKELPFYKAKTEEELINILDDLDEQKVDYSEFNEKFNPLEKGHSTQDVLEYTFNYQKETQTAVSKEKVLIYPGAMITNGITTSFLNLLSNLDDFSKDLYIFLPTKVVGKNKENLAKIPGHFKYIASNGNLVMTSEEAKAYRKLVNRLELTSKEEELVNSVFQRERQRIFANEKFDYIIHFTGYEMYIAELFKTIKAKKIIYIHNDMAKEYALRQNFNYNSIKGFCDVADLIRPVNDELSKKIIQTPLIAKEQKDKVKTAHNLVDAQGVIMKSNLHEHYLTPELVKILEDKETIKFINIARFSPEKGLPRLIEAFKKTKLKNKDKKLKLILIGAQGVDAEKIEKAANQDVLIFKNINPFPILKHCNLFVLSSYHEGLPMVFFEAIVLKVPILSTSISGPKEFLEQGYGNTCENSEEGLIKGMQKYLSGELKPSTKTLDEFNQKAKKEFLDNF